MNGQDKVVTYNKSTSRNTQNRPQRGERLNIPKIDTNNDGLLSKSKVKWPIVNDFDTIDTNGGWYISKEEFETAPNVGQGGERLLQR